MGAAHYDYEKCWESLKVGLEVQSRNKFEKNGQPVLAMVLYLDAAKQEVVLQGIGKKKQLRKTPLSVLITGYVWEGKPVNTPKARPDKKADGNAVWESLWVVVDDLRVRLGELEKQLGVGSVNKQG